MNERSQGMTQERPLPHEYTGPGEVNSCRDYQQKQDQDSFLTNNIKNVIQ